MDDLEENNEIKNEHINNENPQLIKKIKCLDSDDRIYKNQEKILSYSNNLAKKDKTLPELVEYYLEKKLKTTMKKKCNKLKKRLMK